jgi:hypoxanthine phosphoribosyltransferase
LAGEVNGAVTRMAGEINQVLHDALVFAGQLLPQLDFPLEVDTLEAARYGDATQGREPVFRHMPAAAVAGRTVLLIDDILELVQFTRGLYVENHK